MRATEGNSSAARTMRSPALKRRLCAARFRPSVVLETNVTSAGATPSRRGEPGAHPLRHGLPLGPGVVAAALDVVVEAGDGRAVPAPGQARGRRVEVDPLAQIGKRFAPGGEVDRRSASCRAHRPRFAAFAMWRIRHGRKATAQVRSPGRAAAVHISWRRAEGIADTDAQKVAATSRFRRRTRPAFLDARRTRGALAGRCARLRGRRRRRRCLRRGCRARRGSCRWQSRCRRLRESPAARGCERKRERAQDVAMSRQVREKVFMASKATAITPPWTAFRARRSASPARGRARQAHLPRPASRPPRRRLRGATAETQSRD